jgi:hypothetical protein
MSNRDLPSTLDYKDQSMTLEEIQQRERIGVQPLGLGTNQDLPSSLDYKDQALTVEEIQQRRARMNDQPVGLGDVPSSIGYKDQSLSLEEPSSVSRDTVGRKESSLWSKAESGISGTNNLKHSTK